MVLLVHVQRACTLGVSLIAVFGASMWTSFCRWLYNWSSMAYRMPGPATASYSYICIWSGSELLPQLTVLELRVIASCDQEVVRKLYVPSVSLLQFSCPLMYGKPHPYHRLNFNIHALMGWKDLRLLCHHHIEVNLWSSLCMDNKCEFCWSAFLL